MVMMRIFFFLFLLAFPVFTANASVNDFCVANGPGARDTPSGFVCKNTAKVTAADFVYSGLAKPGNTTNIINAAVTPAFVGQFPGVIGLGVTLARLDLAPGGVIPMHTHPGASEILNVVEGTILAAFISSGNKVYEKALYPGDVMVFPQGLLDFQEITGKIAPGLCELRQRNPGLQILEFQHCFPTIFPPKTIAGTTCLDEATIKKLKSGLGGTN
uniref:Germin-like protein n=1 Tax=Ipomoea nil TaxID=35883 RepID=GLP1_IPONI|nr:RecName: Full=Germin-like protein; Flags: Precursor [Ipomoea nil]BAA08266.1 germin-like protein precursor [Ipomoea nil]